jgi:tetratricopeptide (TPR) repeat protein
MKNILLIVCACVALGAGTASADEATEEKVKTLYAQGRAHHEKGEYAEAVKLFKEADALMESAALAYNIAQSYRLMGDCRNALTWYRTYQDRDPLAKNKEKVNEYIAKMIKCLPKKEAAPAPPPPEPVHEVTPPPPAPPPEPTPVAPAPAPAVTPTPAPAVTPAPAPAPAPVAAQPAPVVPPPVQPRDENPGHGKKVAGVVVASLGLVAVGTGIAFGLQASSQADKVTLLSQTGGMWSQSYSDTESAGKRDQTISRFGLVVGSAAVVTGVVLYVVGMHESSAPPPVAAGLRPGGGDLVLSWRY